MSFKPYFRVGIAYSLGLYGLSVSFASAQTSVFETTENKFPITAVSTELNVPLSLKAALEAADFRNPRILAARQEYAISETDVRLARSAKKPLIEANASYGYIEQDNSFTTAPGQSFSGETTDLGVSLRQPLFRGFQTRNAVNRTKAIALATETQIKAIEQQVFLEVITAYLDTHRDFAILRLNLENLEALKEQLEANEKRYQLKDTSLTDVARTKSAVASAYTQIADARANYAASKSTFFRLTGLPAENLEPVTPSDPITPHSIEVFLTKALRNNAAISSAQYALKASEYAVEEAKGARLPSVDLNSSVSRGQRPENFGLFSDNRTTVSANAVVSVRIPIYQAGQEFENIKRSKQIRQLRNIQLTQTTADVRDTSLILWDRLEASKIALASHEEAVNSAETAANGTRKIYRSGLISAIDLLDTEQILLGAKIARENAKHDHIVTAYSLLSVMGDIKYD